MKKSIKGIYPLNHHGNNITFKVAKLNSQNDRKLFLRHFVNYSHELDQYQKAPLDAELNGNVIFSHVGDNAKIYFFSVGFDVCGFLVIGTNPYNCHEECDFYIEEFYIVPKFRRKGYGEKIITHIISETKGRWCLRILTHNSPAVFFWSKVFDKNLNAKEITGNIAPDPLAGPYMFFSAYLVR